MGKLNKKEQMNSGKRTIGLPLTTNNDKYSI